MTIAIDSVERLRVAGEGKFLTMLASRIRRGCLEIAYPDGARRVFSGSADGHKATLELLDERAVRHVITGGATGFAEAYMDGHVDSPDLKALLHLVIDNEEQIGADLRGYFWYRALSRLQHLARPNSRSGSRRNIARHYDLGNGFYGAWLDEGMNYSAGVYKSPTDDLSGAQENKYRQIAEHLQPAPGDHILELGCGWGGLAEWLAQAHGCRVTAITISEAQYTYAKARVARAGLADRVDVQLRDYRDVQGTFDHILSVEMIEAVGEAYWPVFFERLCARLRPGGRAVLQAITIGEPYFGAYRGSADFIRQYIFPGGMLPTLSVIRDQAARAGLRTSQTVAFGADYGRTLDQWAERFNSAWPEIAAMGFDQRFRQMWNYYLAYCAVGFETGRTNVHHVVLQND